MYVQTNSLIGIITLVINELSETEMPKPDPLATPRLSIRQGVREKQLAAIQAKTAPSEPAHPLNVVVKLDALVKSFAVIVTSQARVSAAIADILGTLQTLQTIVKLNNDAKVKEKFVIYDEFEQGSERYVYGWQALGEALTLKDTSCRTRISAGGGVFKLKRGGRDLVVERVRE